MAQKKMKAEELAAMIEDTAAKLSSEAKTAFLLKIVVFLLVTLLNSLGSHDERTITHFESSITYGLPELLNRYR